MVHHPRVLDPFLSEALGQFPAVALYGARAVGKSASAGRIAGSVLSLARPENLSILQADRDRIDRLTPPVLIDDWQHDPAIWDTVRRSVGADRRPGRFLLTGSTNSASSGIHSGTGRIVRIRMRPLSFAERQIESPTVSLAALLHDEPAEIDGSTGVRLDDYVEELLASGFPGIRSGATVARSTELDAYLEHALSRELPALGAAVRRPLALRAWLRAYAAASSSTTSFEAIAAAVSTKARPTRATLGGYREALGQIWLLDEVPAWVPGGNELRRLGQAPKHQLADPALAARLLGATSESLLTATGRADQVGAYRKLRAESLLGALFESLVTLSVRVYAQPSGARVSHLRTHSGGREIDLIVERRDGRVLAIEVKLTSSPDDNDVRHLNWLRDTLGDAVVDRVIVTTGGQAYRRADGVAVVPLALLGP